MSAPTGQFWLLSVDDSRSVFLCCCCIVQQLQKEISHACHQDVISCKLLNICYTSPLAWILWFALLSSAYHWGSTLKEIMPDIMMKWNLILSIPLCIENYLNNTTYSHWHSPYLPFSQTPYFNPADYCQLFILLKNLNLKVKM